MGIEFSNLAEGTLAAGISDSDPALELTSGDGSLFPAASEGDGTYFYATLIKQTGAVEIIKVLEHTGGTDFFTLIVRGQDDTSAIAFSTADKCELRFPKIILEEFRDGIDANTVLIESNDTDIAAIVAKSTADEQVLYGPTGMIMYLYRPDTEIPVGWQVHSGPADALLAIVGGSDAYDVEGETLAGDWAPTAHVHTGGLHEHLVTPDAHVHTGPSHAHTTPSHALSWAEMPVHSHTIASHKYQNGSGEDNHYQADSTNAARQLSTQTSGSGAEHEHGNTGDGGTGDTGPAGDDQVVSSEAGAVPTGNGAAPSTDRPYAAVGLLIERD
jgi:hypothetical protein